MTIGDWDRELAETPQNQLGDYRRALEVLQAWPTFKKEFGWTRIFVLIDCIREAQEAHKRQAAEVQR